jgi:BASS family bile acid:Na+ symporter
MVIRASGFVYRYFLWFLVGSYAVAAVAPAAGLWIREASFGEVEVIGRRARITLPPLMLALLLLNAGLGVRTERLRGLIRGPFILIAGLLVNLIVPLLFILGLSQTLRVWHNPVEVQLILVGLALVASMPVAGSSTAWSQNADGDLALSLGLVVLSTCLSPVTTPAVLHAVGWVASGTYAESLHDLAAGGTSLFLAAFVMLPALTGIGVRCLLGEEPLLRAKPALKLANAVNLLALCYSNAAVALPETVSNPDWDFLAVMLAIVLTLCVVGFASGWAIAQALGADEARRTSLMFGLGMNNNGTGLVLAATALANLPGVMLPVIFYNLVQHVVAAVTGRLRRERPDDAPPPDVLKVPLPLARAS